MELQRSHTFDIDERMTPDVLLAMAEVQQSRSQYQLEKFVINQHDTDEMRYFQTVLELQSLYYTIRAVSLDVKKLELEIQRLRNTGDEIDEIEAQKKELGLEQTRLIATGAFREFDHLMKIFNSFKKKYTREEIESAQPKYWEKRMHRQAVLEAVSNSSAQAAHLDSLRQMGVLEITDNGVIPTQPVESRTRREELA